MSDLENASLEGTNQYVGCWGDAFVHVLGQLAGLPFNTEIATPPPELTLQEQDLSLLILNAGGLRGEMIIRLPDATTIAFAQLILGEARDGSIECKPEHKEAAEELVRQVTGHVVTGLKSSWGDVQLHVKPSGPASWGPAVKGWMALVSGDVRVWIEYQMSAALATALRVSRDTATSAVSKEPVPRDGTLELLLDVELETTLRFGGRNMRLKEVLELDSGSIVELDRQVPEPADLFLDGKLLARGEVVVVEGNYGLRITEVVSLASAATAVQT